MYENELKPCPFCGGAAHITVYYPNTEGEYFCVDCEECGVQSMPDTVDELIKHWNTRVFVM